MGREDELQLSKDRLVFQAGHLVYFILPRDAQESARLNLLSRNDMLIT
jgi:hypothetical protein